MTDLKNEPIKATVIFEDNQSAICMATNPQFHGQAEHIGIKYYFIWEQINNGTVKLKYCRTDEMISDILNKGLHQDNFVKL